MGELDEVVPPLNISPQGPAETGRRAGDPGPCNRSLTSVEGPGFELPAITRRRRPSPPAAVRVLSRGRAPAGSSSGSCSLSGSRVLHSFHGFGQPTGVRSRQRWLPSLVLALCLALGWTAIPTEAAASPGPRVEARAAVVMDAATGAVLWQRQAHRPVLVASTTKILTAIVANDFYPPRKLLRVPEAAERVDGTRFGYRTGWRIRREQLLTTLLLVSANDAAETLAAAWPDGGRAGFLRAMQAKAAELGCTDSTWRDPSGLDAPGHRASAADLAVLGRALLARPLLAKLVRLRAVAYRWPSGHRTVLANHNHFVGRGRDPGAIGVKTGYTTRAGSTIVAAQRRGGRTLLAVALGSKTMYDDVRAMFRYGFKAKPRAGAERLGLRPAPPPGPGPAPTLPPAAERITGRVSGTPSPLIERLGVRILAAPVPLAACAGVACLLLGSLALFRHRR
jgi:serine-type D-Ala-D-Ala carboxypeptidase (penicillin-binding protein 5/6)